MDASVNRIASSKDERSLLISIRLRGEDLKKLTHSLDELKLLVKTAGGVLVHNITISRDKIDSAYIIGKGYLEKLADMIKEKNIKLIVFDLNNIRPAQVRNLEEKLKCRVVGRNEIIIEIFARRAKSAEAKIQVELAQLHYILPRLKGLGGVLSRLGGGIGTRGPGEKMLETDRRHILRRITKLKKNLTKFESHRERTRKSRGSEVVGTVVGYTNAGKSTLINFLAKDDLFVENRLFATLDSYTRNVFLEIKKSVLLTDTVGFITNLPVNLIESFRSTLEEIKSADFILKVIDLTSDNMENDIKTVDNELKNLDVLDKPIITFFSKSDKLEDEQLINLMKIKYPGSVVGSVINNDGIADLKIKLLEVYNQIKRI